LFLANRREARKLGLLQSKSSAAERERLEPLERNERVCRGHPDTYTNNISGIIYNSLKNLDNNA
jgi:hypothetical protein